VSARPLRRNREFLALWVGEAVSNLGISISSFAYPLVVLEATGSPAKAGLVGTVLAGTAFFLRLPAGVLVDRWNRKAILIACDAGRALNAAGFAAALAWGSFFLPHVLAVAFVEAALGVLFGPAEAAAVRRVVAPDQVREAIARNESRSAVPGLVGPPLGGVLIAAARALPFVADAISYLVSLVCVVTVRTPLDEPADEADSRSVASVFAGVRWIWRHAFLRPLFLWLVPLGVVFSSIGLVTLVLARDRGASPRELGAMYAITAAGGVVGAFAAPAIVRRLPARAVIASFGWIAVAAAFLLVVAHSPYAIGLLGASAFLLAPAINTIAFATIASEAPGAMQGRATSAGIQLARLGGPIGPVLAGALLASLGATTTLVVYGSVLFLLAVVASASSRFEAAA
jgi:predicted MFS family arabinose efflux permease